MRSAPNHQGSYLPLQAPLHQQILLCPKLSGSPHLHPLDVSDLEQWHVAACSPHWLSIFGSVGQLCSFSLSFSELFGCPVTAFVNSQRFSSSESIHILTLLHCITMQLLILYLP